ncbi:MFS transporter [Streptomyces sp. ID38640]|uniref:MFS transporter n=1 Tax=Streptomyces sp. ID38640 TaxID=1265399 RepID=UPI000D22719E|nr:MFS transporter [Streptomyces sp. ID38640]AVT42381.1 major facilitator superfamily protein [Streptomyces sp.]QIK05394.1 MFS transporter [Streptomyces sp. ID38640]
MGGTVTGTSGRAGAFMTAMVVDALGSGVWITFSLLYFTYGQGMALTAAGSALSAGSLTALLAGGLAAGVLTDRMGPFPAAVLSCAIRAVAFPCYLLADSPATVAVTACAISFGDRLYWAAHAGLVGSVTTEEHEQRRLFALMNSLRNVGLGVGALAVALAASFEEADGTALWHLIPLVNAVSFAVAGVMFRWVGRGSGPVASSQAGHRTGASYRGVLANRRFLAFTGATLSLTLSSVAFDSILPVYLRSLGLPLWMPPVVYVLSCVAIPACQPLALSLGRRYPPMRLMALAAALVAVSLGALVLLGSLAGVAGTVLIVLLVLVFSLGEAVFGAVAMTLVLSFATPQDAGRYSALYQLAWGLSGALGPGVHTLLFSVSGSAPWAVMACALLVGAAVYLRLARTSPRDTAPAPHSGDPVDRKERT